MLLYRPLVRNRSFTRQSGWDETLRLAASTRAGTVAPSILMRQLTAYPKQNALAKALRDRPPPQQCGVADPVEGEKSALDPMERLPQ
jgi:hypothetical protein